MKYECNAIFQSPLTDSFYFVAKAKILPNGGREVVGEKIDVTPYVKAIIRRAVIDAYRQLENAK